MDPVLTPLLLQFGIEGLKLANKILDTQPPEVAAAAWHRHERIIKWWEDAFLSITTAKPDGAQK